MQHGRSDDQVLRIAFEHDDLTRGGKTLGGIRVTHPVSCPAAIHADQYRLPALKVSDKRTETGIPIGDTDQITRLTLEPDIATISTDRGAERVGVPAARAIFADT